MSGTTPNTPFDNAARDRITCCILFTAFAAMGIAVFGAAPRATSLPIAPKAPLTETVTGFIHGRFSAGEAWGNNRQQFTKTFDLVDSLVAPSRSDLLAVPTEAIYRTLEKYDGSQVRLTVIRAKREGSEWLIVLSLEVLP